MKHYKKWWLLLVLSIFISLVVVSFGSAAYFEVPVYNRFASPPIYSSGQFECQKEEVGGTCKYVECLISDPEFNVWSSCGKKSGTNFDVDCSTSTRNYQNPRQIRAKCYCTPESVCGSDVGSSPYIICNKKDDCSVDCSNPIVCSEEGEICKKGYCEEEILSCSALGGTWCDPEKCIGDPIEVHPSSFIEDDKLCCDSCSITPGEGEDGCGLGEVLVSAPDNEDDTGCCSGDEGKCWDGDGCLDNKSKLNKYICLDGDWKVECPNPQSLQTETRDAGCRGYEGYPPPKGKYSNPLSPDEYFCQTGFCYECIEGTTWDGNDCVPEKVDWEGVRGVCTAESRCFCNKTTQGCEETNFNDFISSEEKGRSDGLCVHSGEYFEDHYCKSGNWTTRTGLLAAQFLNYIEELNVDDYVLYCDYYTETLYEYPDTLDDEDFNNFCVLRDNDYKEIGFGTSLNLNQDQITSFLGSIFSNMGTISCDLNSHEFSECGNPEKLHYYGDVKSFIYGIDPTVTGVDKFIDFISNPFKWVYKQAKRVFGKPDPFTIPSDFDKFYLNKKSDKKIEASYKDDKIVARYINFGVDTDICGAVGTDCKKEGDTHYVLSYHPDKWSDLTTKLRIK